MDHHRDLAAQAAHEAGQAKTQADAASNGLAAIAFALLDVADAIREASKPADDEAPHVNHSRDW